MKECDLYIPVRDWLNGQGYKVIAEFRGHDVAAIKGNHIIVVELKLSLTRGLLHQCDRAACFADAVYAGVPRMPRESSLARCRQPYQVGVLVISESVGVILEPVRRCFDVYHALTVEFLTHRQPDDRIGGLPNIAGEGPAQRVAKLVEAYRRENPNATWRDIYHSVPNHYAHHKSMQQAMQDAAVRALRSKPLTKSTLMLDPLPPA